MPGAIIGVWAKLFGLSENKNSEMRRGWEGREVWEETGRQKRVSPNSKKEEDIIITFIVLKWT